MPHVRLLAVERSKPKQTAKNFVCEQVFHCLYVIQYHMLNQQISQIFREIAKILEIKNGNPFAIRAYERAALNIDGLTQGLEEFIKKERLREIPGIGKDLADKIKEFQATGKIRAHIELKKTIPKGLLDLLNIPGVGPKTAGLLYKKLKIESIAGLEKAIKQNKLKGIFGIKEKTIENILKGIELLKKVKERMSLAKAMLTANDFIGPLINLREIKNLSIAGSLRRQKESVRDIDILAASSKPKKIMEAFIGIPAVGEVLAKGQTKASVRTKDGVQIDCRVVKKDSFGAALLYFTGSKNFNIKIRQMAVRMGLKINEYGVFRKNKLIAGKTEEEVFKTLGIAYIEPELREDTGEIESAKENKLPLLIKTDDLKGDLHTHSEWSDGANTIKELAQAAQKLGYSYIAVTDHSQSLKIAGGLSIAGLKKKRDEINRINKTLTGFRVLYGTEVDIGSDGNLDYDDRVLKEFDVAIAAIHTGFKQSKEQLTRRLVNACRNKHVHIIAHPSGRLLGSREAYELDWDELFKTASDTNTHLEINSFSDRMDLNDLHCRRAKVMGVKLAINTDAHTIEQLGMLKLGIAIARRGWLTKEDVINTLCVEELLKEIKK